MILAPGRSVEGSHIPAGVDIPDESRCRHEEQPLVVGRKAIVRGSANSARRLPVPMSIIPTVLPVVPQTGSVRRESDVGVDGGQLGHRSAGAVPEMISDVVFFIHQGD